MTGEYGTMRMVMQARAHWEEFRPTMYRELKLAGRLEEALETAARMTIDEVGEMLENGIGYHEAWEVVRDKYLFLREE